MIFQTITLLDTARPLASRAKSRKYAGPYKWSPTRPNSGRGFYAESGAPLRMARHGAGLGLRLEYANDVFDGRPRLANKSAWAALEWAKCTTIGRTAN
jgi:hypothetical protein